MDSQKHRKWTGVGNELILQNLWKLHLNGARIRLRLPLVEGVNAEEEDILPVIGLLKKDCGQRKSICCPTMISGGAKPRGWGTFLSRPFRHRPGKNWKGWRSCSAGLVSPRW